MQLKSEYLPPIFCLTLLPPSHTLSMDELTCLGCGKAFSSRKRLSAHETLCETHQDFSRQVSKSYRHAERSRKSKRRKINNREFPLENEDGNDILPDPPQDMGDMGAGDWHIQACCDFQHSRLKFDLTHRMKIFLDHLNDPLHIPHPLPQPCAPIVRDVLFACPDDMPTSFLAMTWLGMMRSCPKKIFTLRTS